MYHINEMKKILILNGPNLNLLGRREPEVYGDATLDDINAALIERFPDVEFSFLQSNHEGALIDAVQESASWGEHSVDGVVLNAGGYSHTSVALGDAIRAVDVPVIEVHISNVAAREDFRHHSMLSAACRGTIQGLGTDVYSLAVRALIGRC